MRYLRLFIFALLCACGADGPPERPARAASALAVQAVS